MMTTMMSQIFADRATSDDAFSEFQYGEIALVRVAVLSSQQAKHQPRCTVMYVILNAPQSITRILALNDPAQCTLVDVHSAADATPSVLYCTAASLTELIA